MGAVEDAVRGDQFRLDPQAELHAQRVNPLAQAGKAVGQLAQVVDPVAQGAVVAVPVAEPAVVEHKEIDAHALRRLGQGEELLLVKAEVGCLPVLMSTGRCMKAYWLRMMFPRLKR